MDIFDWLVFGLLTSVTGELILPGRNPAGIGVSLLLGAAGSLLARFVVGLSRGAEVTRFGVEAILWAVLGAFAVLALYLVWVRVFEHGRRRQERSVVGNPQAHFRGVEVRSSSRTAGRFSGRRYSE